MYVLDNKCMLVFHVIQIKEETNLRWWEKVIRERLWW